MTSSFDDILDLLVRDLVEDPARSVTPGYLDDIVRLAGEGTTGDADVPATSLRETAIGLMTLAIERASRGDGTPRATPEDATLVANRLAAAFEPLRRVAGLSDAPDFVPRYVEAFDAGCAAVPMAAAVRMMSGLLATVPFNVASAVEDVNGNETIVRAWTIGTGAFLAQELAGCDVVAQAIASVVRTLEEMALTEGPTAERVRAVGDRLADVVSQVLDTDEGCGAAQFRDAVRQSCWLGLNRAWSIPELAPLKFRVLTAPFDRPVVEAIETADTAARNVV